MTQDIVLIDYIVKISTIITPLLIIGLSGIGWKLKNSIERKNILEQKLREDRVKIYNEVVQPYIYMFSNEAIKSERKDLKGKTISEEGLRKLPTVEYRESSFKMLLFGSDGVVRAHNNIQKLAFSSANEEMTPERHKKWLLLLGDLFLEIRKSMGNENTKLSNLEMLESIITDIHQIKEW